MSHSDFFSHYHGSLPHPDLYWCPECGKRWAYYNNHLECTCGNSIFLPESLTLEQSQCLPKKIGGN